MKSDLTYFLSWYFFIVLIGWLVFPLTFHFFRRIPDRGLTMSKIMGLLLAGFIHWFMNSLGMSQNTPGGIWAAIVILAVLSLWSIHQNGFTSMWKWITQNLGLVLVVEVVFLLAFMGLAWLRAYNPDIFGTEKPMELMFINSILRSPTFPPQDAWLAGYSISYYYFGYVMVAIISILTSTPAGVAFNLAIALIFALTFTAAFGVLLNLIARMGEPKAEGKSDLLRSVPVSLIAPIVLLVVGNFYGILDVLHAHHVFAEAQVPAIWFQTGSIYSETQTVISPQVIYGRINFWEWMDLKQLGPIPARDVPFQGIQQGNWFFASRTIHDRNLMGYDPEAIDEFPAFSFLLADLHPHVLGLPFVLLVILMSFEWLLDMRLRKWEDPPAAITWNRIGLSAVVLGSLIFLNTWDFPFYVFLFLLSGSLAYFFQRIEGWDWKSLIMFLRPMGRVVLISVLLYLPFLLTLQSQAGGIIPNVIYPTKFRQLFVMFGPVLIGVVCLMLAVVRKFRKEVDFKTGWKITGGFLVMMIFITTLLVILMLSNPETANFVNSAISPFTINEALGWLLIRRVVEGGTLLLGLLLMAGSIGVLWGLRKHGSESILFVFALVITGTLLLLGPEFVYLRDNFGWRMNTLFKFYFQIWILWAISASFGFWYLLKRVQGWGRVIAIVLMVAGFLTGIVYTIGTIQSTTAGIRNSVETGGMRQPTLDGLAFYSLYHPDDWALIQWFNTNVEESAVVLEGTKGAYWIEGRSSRVSMMTGLPTVMGWVNHEAQWRGNDFASVAARENDIRMIYTERDWAITEQLLDQYDITYVVFSPLEREWYGGIQQSKFDQHMQRVFENGDFVIYQR
jgi:YYY domain-containing protein